MCNNEMTNTEKKKKKKYKEMNLTKNCEPCERLTVNLPFLSQGTVVLRVNIRLVILTRKGRGIESQSFYFFFLYPIRRGGLVKKNVSLRKWAATKRDGNAGAARGRGKTGRRFRRRVKRNRATRPRGLVCKSGLVIGYWNDNAEWRWFASKKGDWMVNAI